MKFTSIFFKTSEDFFRLLFYPKLKYEIFDRLKTFYRKSASFFQSNKVISFFFLNIVKCFANKTTNNIYL